MVKAWDSFLSEDDVIIGLMPAARQRRRAKMLTPPVPGECVSWVLG
jgi:hypothetical protein